MKTEVMRAALKERRREPAGWTTSVGGEISGMDRITLRRWAKALGGGDRGQREEKMEDARVEEEGEGDIAMGESLM